jgi:hypothetical protein
LHSYGAFAWTVCLAAIACGGNDGTSPAAVFGRIRRFGIAQVQGAPCSRTLTASSAPDVPIENGAFSFTMAAPSLTVTGSVAGNSMTFTHTAFQIAAPSCTQPGGGIVNNLGTPAGTVTATRQ